MEAALHLRCGLRPEGGTGVMRGRVTGTAWGHCGQAGHLGGGDVGAQTRMMRRAGENIPGRGTGSTVSR